MDSAGLGKEDARASLSTALNSRHVRLLTQTGGPPAPKKKRVTKDGWQERVKQILRADAIASSLETLSIEESRFVTNLVKRRS